MIPHRYIKQTKNMKEFVTIKDIWMFLLAAPVYSMEYKISIFFILCISSRNIRKKIENKKKSKI